MVKRYLSAIALLVIARGGIAQEINLQAALQELMDTAVQLNITARVLPPNETPVWNVRDTKLTVPGRSVAVKMTGNNIRVDVVLTPYVEADGKLLLLAQGQVWLSEASEKQVRYHSTLKSIPLAWGEKVLFYPLGLADTVSDHQVFNLQLEIQVLPYRSKAESISH